MISKVITESNNLEKRFYDMNKDYLKDGQWECIDNTWNEKMSELYRRLKRNSNQ